MRAMMALKQCLAFVQGCVPSPRRCKQPHQDEHPAMRPNASDRTKSEIKHQTYLDSLPVPNLEQIKIIARAQEEKEKEIEEKYNKREEDAANDNSAETERRDRAANTIQVRTIPLSYFAQLLTSLSL